MKLQILSSCHFTFYHNLCINLKHLVPTNTTNFIDNWQWLWTLVTRLAYGKIKEKGPLKKPKTLGSDLSLAAPASPPEALPSLPFSPCPEQNRRSPSLRGGSNERLHTGGGVRGGGSFQILENLIVLLLFTCRSALISVSLNVVALLTPPPCPLQSLTEGCVHPCVFPCACM